MPQMFHVLKCYKCSVFQVHQTKKSNKWKCKLCGEKQSVKRHYGLGTGKECRLHVQKLNGIRGEIDEQNISEELNKSSDEELENNTLNIKQVMSVKRKANKSKWSNYINETELQQEPEENDSMYLGNTEVVLEVPVKKRKKFKPPTSTVQSIPNLPSYGPSEHAYNAESVEPMYNFQSNNCHSYEMHKPILCTQTASKSNVSDSSANNFFKTNTFKVNTTDSNAQVPSKIGTHYKFTDVINEQAKEKSNPKDENQYIPPKINKNSKWAEFADEPDESNLTMSIENSSNICISQDYFVENVLSSQGKAVENAPSQEKLKKISTNVSSSKNVFSDLFHICDDSELENILDF